MIREYKTIEEVAGPLMLVKKVDGVKYDELGEIELPGGEVRRCRVLEVDGSNVLVQLFESAQGLNIADSKVRFSGHGIQLPVSRDMLGRVFSGMGEPIDGGPQLIPDKTPDINGTPINPAARCYPSEFIQTGVSTIDGLYRRAYDAYQRSEAAYILGLRLAARVPCGADRASGKGARRRRLKVRRCVRGCGHYV